MNAERRERYPSPHWYNRRASHGPMITLWTLGEGCQGGVRHLGDSSSARLWQQEHAATTIARQRRRSRSIDDEELSLDLDLVPGMWAGLVGAGQAIPVGEPDEPDVTFTSVGRGRCGRLGSVGRPRRP